MTERILFPLTGLLMFLGSVSAQTCWKNTTCSGPLDTAFPGPWESNIFAPSSRTVYPALVLDKSGILISSYNGTAQLSRNISQLVFDFGIEVGGLVTINYTAIGAGQVGLAFTESKNWIGEASDSSNGKFVGPDGALYATFFGSGKYGYTMPDIKLRGGFRYLTLFLITNGTASVSFNNIELAIGFQPTWSNLRAYQGYFHSNDEELNKIWYSGAYTLQTNAVPVNTGRHIPALSAGWQNDGVLGPGDTIIVDGAKRDRAVWPGDMGIAVPSSFVSIGDLQSVKNALQVMYNYQDPTTGAFPEAGPPLLQLGSDTYHMWTMIGTYNYLLYSNDTVFLQQNWAKYLLAMTFIYGKVNTQGLLNVTGIRDWARWQTGGNGSEPNMILYQTLQTGANLALWANDTTGLSTTWLNQAAKLKTAINTFCFDTTYGAFYDNATITTLHPQDANSMSLLFSVVDSNSTRAQSISTRLLDNWTPIGAETPELAGNISPFISSFEIQAHFTIGQTARALELIRRCWGWYLSNPLGTQSTVIEGYLTNSTFGYRSTRGYDYDASYVSHSHGWSSGPTSALTNFVLGLSVTGRAGSTWKIAPQFGDLKTVEGGFVTTLGKFQASWVTSTNQTTGYSLNFTVPAKTTGVIVLPTLIYGEKPVVAINGSPEPKSMAAKIVGAGLILSNVAGGTYKVIVTPS